MELRDWFLFVLRFSVSGSTFMTRGEEVWMGKRISFVWIGWARWLLMAGVNI